jgi:REP element-mobilizing transposase RayT
MRKQVKSNRLSLHAHLASKFDLQRHHRRSIRYKGYDYTQPGAYFVTIVTQGRHCLFGDIVECHMRLSHLGQIVQATWQDLPTHYPHIRLDEFVVMPNHVHGIIVLIDDGSRSRGGSGDPPLPDPPLPDPTLPKTVRHGLPEIVRAFKSFSARRINQILNNKGASLWQRNYYERIIRNTTEWERIRLYIQNNPMQWDSDRDNPRKKAA